MRVNRARLRQYRHLAGFTQKALARRAGVSVGTIKGGERGRGVHGGTLKKIALALNVDIMQLMNGLAKAPKVDIPRFLLHHILPDHVDHDIEAAFRDGVIADMHREFDRARLRFEQALEADAGNNLDVTAQLIIRCAAAMDNARQSREALAMLDPLLSERRWRDVQPQIRSWLKYHVGVVHRRIAETNDATSSSHLHTAEVLLKEVETTGADPDTRIAATHQLGCVWLVKGRQTTHAQRRSAAWRHAVRYFNEARKKWQKKSNFREGYSLRRLADIAQLAHDHRAAHSYLLDALEVFVRYDCYRYRDEVRAELDQLVANWGRGGC
jgi:transcriptional regulator with XRE-family HTH domain